jgi:hypothetical protein
MNANLSKLLVAGCVACFIDGGTSLAYINPPSERLEASRRSEYGMSLPFRRAPSVEFEGHTVKPSRVQLPVDDDQARNAWIQGPRPADVELYGNTPKPDLDLRSSVVQGESGSD